MHELILYLTPSGELGRHCDEFFREAERQFGPTVANMYPPHVTLTGFFRRTAERHAAVCAEIAAALPIGGAVPADQVSVVGLRSSPDWVGLEVSSTWARELTTQLIDAHAVLPGEDALRPKDWLHLSLAYGLDTDQKSDDFVVLASEMIDLNAQVSWQAALWERHANGHWTQPGSSGG